MISALVPTGTSGAVNITFNSSGAGYYRPRIAVYAVTNLQSTTPYDLQITTGTPTGAPKTFTGNQVKDGVLFFGSTVCGNSTTRTMSGISTDFSVSPVSLVQYIGGADATSTTGTTSITVTGGTSGQWAAIVAAFR